MIQQGLCKDCGRGDFGGTDGCIWRFLTDPDQLVGLGRIRFKMLKLLLIKLNKNLLLFGVRMTTQAAQATLIDHPGRISVGVAM